MKYIFLMFCIYLFQGSVQAAQNIIPVLVETYTTPANEVLLNADYTSSGTLVLTKQYTGTDDRLEFDPISEAFSTLPGFLNYDLAPDTIWDVSTEAAISYSSIPTGWADYCNGIYYAGGYGGASLNQGIYSYGYNRSIHGLTFDGSGKIIALIGSDLGSPCLSPDYLEIVELEINPADLSVSHNLLFDLSPFALNIDPFFSYYSNLDHDSERNIFWLFDQVEDQFLGMDQTGNLLYTVPWGTYTEIPALVHFQSDQFFVTDGTDALYLIELSFDSSVSDWMTYQ